MYGIRTSGRRSEGMEDWVRVFDRGGGGKGT